MEPPHSQTFLNQPLAAVAGLGVLDIVEKGHLTERARAFGAIATERFQKFAQRFEMIGGVRGLGLFIGVYFVEDRRTKFPAAAAGREA